MRPLVMTRRRFVVLLMSLPALWTVGATSAQPLTRRAKRRWVMGAITLHFAQVKNRRIYYSLLMFYRIVGNSVRAYPYITRIDADLAKIDTLKTIESQIAAQLAGGAMVETLAPNMARIIASLRGSSAVKATPVSSRQAQALLGAPNMVQGRLAQLSDNADRAALGAGAVAGGGSAIVQVMTWRAAESLVVVSQASAPAGAVAAGWSGAATAGLAVTVAAAGGVAVGWGINEVAGAITSAATDGDASSVGEWLATTAFGRAISSVLNDTDPETGAVGDGDAPPPAPNPPDGGAAPQPDGSNDDQDAGTDDQSGADAGEDEENNDESSDDSTGDNCSGADCDSSEENDDGDDQGSAQDEGSQADNEDGTTLPPDMDTSGSGVGNLILYGVTGLVRQEMQQQLNALSLAAGGLWGIERLDIVNANLLLDQLVGGGYLKSIERGLSTRRGRYGLRDTIETGGGIDVTRLPNYGLINPTPLDVLFQGRTLRTRALRRIDR